jgi:hypothetical protein
MDKRNIKPNINYRKLLDEKHINGESKQTKMRGKKNYITQNNNNNNKYNRL